MTHPDTLTIPRAVVEQALAALREDTANASSDSNYLARLALSAALQAQPTPPVGQAAAEPRHMEEQPDGSVIPVDPSEMTVARPVAWIRKHPDGTYSNELLCAWHIEKVRRESGAWIPLYTTPQPTPDAEAIRLERDEYRTKYNDTYAALDDCARANTKAQEAIRLALEIIHMQRDWIMAVPKEAQLPTMPGFDRDWVDGKIAALEKVNHG